MIEVLYGGGREVIVARKSAETNDCSTHIASGECVLLNVCYPDLVKWDQFPKMHSCKPKFMTVCGKWITVTGLLYWPSVQ